MPEATAIYLIIGGVLVAGGYFIGMIHIGIKIRKAAATAKRFFFDGKLYKIEDI